MAVGQSRRAVKGGGRQTRSQERLAVFRDVAARIVPRTAAAACSQTTHPRARQSTAAALVQRVAQNVAQHGAQHSPTYSAKRAWVGDSALCVVHALSPSRVWRTSTHTHTSTQGWRPGLRPSGRPEAGVCAARPQSLAREWPVALRRPIWVRPPANPSGRVKMHRRTPATSDPAIVARSASAVFTSERAPRLPV